MSRRPMGQRRMTLMALVLGLLVAAPVAVPIVTRSPRAAAAGEELFVEPKCVNGGAISLTFSGTGFLDDSSIQIRDEHQNNKLIGLAGTNKSGDFSNAKSFAGQIPAKPTGYYTFNANDQGGNTASRAITVPCPTLSLRPNCGPVGTTPSETYDIFVSGRNWPPVLADVPSQIDVAFDGQTFAPTAFADEFGAFGITIKVPRKPAGTHQVSATDRRDGQAVSVPFLVPCVVATTTTVTAPPTTTTVTTAPPPVVGPAPACALSPPVGPPGFVTQVSCQNFPANATATLRWAPGLGTTTAKVGPDGKFRASMLIMPHDTLGPRQLIAEAPGVSVPVPFLVVTPTVSPSGGDVATRLAPQLVIRQ